MRAPARTYERNMHPNLDAPIPESVPITGWKQVPIVETDRSHEPLVAVGMFSPHPRILTSSVYADEHLNSPYAGGLEGSNIAVFLREGVADKLELAARLLPRGMHLMVMDGYRSLEVQAALFEQYRQLVATQHPEWSEEEISMESQKYISIPSTDPSRPSPHNTGAAVDAVIVRVDDETQARIDKIDALLRTSDLDWRSEYSLTMQRNALVRHHAHMLDFGTRFDHGGPKAALRYLEEESKRRELTDAEKVQLSNRRVLYHVMATAGLQPYEDEWWHYNDPASQMGARVAGLDHAEYGAAQLSDENRAFAQMREQHHSRTLRLADGEEWLPPQGLEEQYHLARAHALGDSPRIVRHLVDAVDKLEPPDSDKVA